MYIGPIAIHSIVPKKISDHFLYLNVAMTIFLSPNFNHFATLAKSFMFDFDFGILYGDHFISHNIHGLIHLLDDFQNYGSLGNISCFKFENYLGQLKKMVRKSDKPLQQIVRMYEERSKSSTIIDDSFENKKETVREFLKLHNEGPLLEEMSSLQYKIILLDKIKIKFDSDADSYVGLKLMEL